MKDHPASVIDPVCGMTVDVDRAEAADLIVEHDGRTFAFCRSGCKRAFLEEPDVYVAAVLAAGDRPLPMLTMAPPSGAALPVIDEGMRLWYESCSCCLSDAFPEVKAALDAERAAAAAPPVAAGICEVAEGAVAGAEAEPIPTPAG